MLSSLSKIFILASLASGFACKSVRSELSNGGQDGTQSNTSGTECFANITEQHQQIFLENYKDDGGGEKGKISFRPVFKEYFLPAFAVIPVQLLRFYFRSDNAYIQLTQGLQHSDPNVANSQMEYVIQDTDGRIAVKLHGRSDELGFKETPRIFINISDDVIAAVDQGKVDENIRSKIAAQMNGLARAFAVYFAYEKTVNMGTGVQLQRSSLATVATTKRRLAFRMLAEMRHNSTDQSNLFATGDIRRMIANEQWMQPIKEDVEGWIDADRAKLIRNLEAEKDKGKPKYESSPLNLATATEYQKFHDAYKNGKLREFGNWTLALFTLNTMCPNIFQSTTGQRFDMKQFPVTLAYSNAGVFKSMVQDMLDSEEKAQQRQAGKEISDDSEAIIPYWADELP